ncbi:cyclin-like protein [Hyaloraphidium curvatum]|nr:cyclin-like protein [Hyaloraphidium curvatum]
MAANYWDSSQVRNWSLDKWRLKESQKEDLKYVSERQLQWLNLYYSGLVVQLGRKLGVRQQVVSTAQVYFRRYYTRNSMRSTDPILVIATCMFLATKVEECPHHIKNVVEGMRAILPDGFQYESTHVAEFEFYLLEEMDFYMILYHPYRPLVQYLDDLNLDRNCLQTSWSILNDVYRTSLPLLHPPHMIALAVIYLLTATDEFGANGEGAAGNEAAPKVDIAKWLGELTVDIAGVIAIAGSILELYAELKEYDERVIPQLVRKLNAKP